MLNVAGITVDSPITRTDKSVFDRVIDVNAGGTFNFCKHVARYMKRQRSGSIVNTSSVTAQFGTQMGTPYSASKAAILGITRSLAMELAPWNVRVNAVAPGVVNTEMVSNLNEQERESCARSIPLARLGRAPRHRERHALPRERHGLVHNRQHAERRRRIPPRLRAAALKPLKLYPKGAENQWLVLKISPITAPSTG